jgi:hypothetical protein
MKYAKQVADAVHRTIGLTEVELAVVDCAAFQRLRSVKQLGLASLVYPGADYSRFAHSLGVCHVVGRMVEALGENGSGIDDRKAQNLRLAGLLHDIGHYPFSHTAEHAFLDHHAAQSLLVEAQPDNGEQSDEEESPPPDKSPMKHERVGKELLLHDPEIPDVLRRFGVEPSDVAAIFSRESADPLRNLVSSDLDADRIDFLLRTAHFTGLAYAAVDLDYLVSQVRQDEQRRVCFTHKAQRAADHLLVGRYFDYQQVAFHKAVVGLEEVLKSVLRLLVEEGTLDGSRQKVEAMVRDASWAQFDDTFVWTKIRELATRADVEGALATALARRRPPKLIADAHVIGDRNAREPHLLRLRFAQQLKGELESKLGLAGRVFLWTDERPLTKIGARIPVDYDGDSDAFEQSVFILKKDGRTSEPIMRHKSSLMGVLSEKQLNAIRLYVLFPEEWDDNEKKQVWEARDQTLTEGTGWS